MSAQRSREHILVVDDQPSNLHLVSSVLRKAGYTVDICASAEASLEMLDQTRYGVVLLDIMLGGMSGLDVLDRIREGDGPNRSSAIIIYTSDATAHNRHQAASLGASMFLERPIRPAMILEAVDLLVGDSNSQAVN